ncbi:unnamed protein product [Meganyctiphanes norvegica]|uniref:BZIP domain-containing protein n=1 Tax=Meganyctiphanes norvegica TaxID=48144 RepID=A0AAV2SGJ4_MEGNR
MALQSKNYILSPGEESSEQCYSNIHGTVNGTAISPRSGCLLVEGGYSLGPSFSSLDKRTRMEAAVGGPSSDLHQWHDQGNQTMNCNYLGNIQMNNTSTDVIYSFNDYNYSAVGPASTHLTGPSSIQPRLNCCPGMVPNSSVPLKRGSRIATWELSPQEDPGEELKLQRTIRLHNNRERNRRHKEDLSQSLRRLNQEVDQLQVKKSNTMKRIHDLKKQVQGNMCD